MLTGRNLYTPPELLIHSLLSEWINDHHYGDFYDKKTREISQRNFLNNIVREYLGDQKITTVGYIF